jgi:excisionase family DNA binding protein
MYGKRLSGYMSIAEVAEKLNINRQGVYKLIKKNEIEPVYVGEAYLISEKEIEIFKKKRAAMHISDGRYKIVN